MCAVLDNIHSDFLATLAVFQKINLFIGKKAVACQKSNKWKAFRSDWMGGGPEGGE